MAKVEAKSSSIIQMAGIYSIPISRLDLTPWDLQLLPLDPIQKGILFRNPPSKQTLIDDLKNSLSRTLDFFPPLAGRLAAITNDDGTNSFYIDCNGAGVQFVHAAATATSVSDILEATYIPEIVSSFFPHNGVPNYEGVSNPLLAVQVTELYDGVFIGCAANHAVVDGISFWHFVNSWSEISRGEDKISKTPILRPWFPKNASVDDRRLIHIPPVEKTSPPPASPLLERVFHFSRETLNKLKTKANSESGTDKISSLQALSAHLWRSVSRCRYSETTLDDTKEAPFVMLVGARGRIPLPEGYFGNAVMCAKTAASAADLVREGVGYAAMKINELVSYQTKEAIIKLVEDWVENPTLLQKGSYAFIIASSPRHNVYGNDFGWGNPVAVRSGPGQKADGKMTVYPAAEAGGIDVEVCLAPETMRAIESDAEFLTPFAV